MKDTTSVLWFKKVDKAKMIKYVIYGTKPGSTIGVQVTP